METKTIKLADLRIDGGTQPRVEIVAEAVSDYKEHIDKLPPVKVKWDGAHYWLWDGFHRYHAHREAGRTEIVIEVENGTKRDAILASFRANSEPRGLRRSNADKRNAVTKLLEDEEWSKWSDSEIARRCAVDQKTVGSVRNSLRNFLSEKQVVTERTFINRHGQTSTMDVSRIGRNAERHAKAVAADDTEIPDRRSMLEVLEDDARESRKSVQERKPEPRQPAAIPVILSSSVDRSIQVLLQRFDLKYLRELVAGLQKHLSTQE